MIASNLARISLCMWGTNLRVFRSSVELLVLVYGFHQKLAKIDYQRIEHIVSSHLPPSIILQYSLHFSTYGFVLQHESQEWKC